MLLFSRTGDVPLNDDTGKQCFCVDLRYEVWNIMNSTTPNWITTPYNIIWIAWDKVRTCQRAWRVGKSSPCIHLRALYASSETFVLAMGHVCTWILIKHTFFAFVTLGRSQNLAIPRSAFPSSWTYQVWEAYGSYGVICSSSYLLAIKSIATVSDLRCRRKDIQSSRKWTAQCCHLLPSKDLPRLQCVWICNALQVRAQIPHLLANEDVGFVREQHLEGMAQHGIWHR